MPTIAIVLCKYVLIAALTYCVPVLLESLCKLVAKVNYNMFQSQPFRMWRSHAATTKMNDCRNYTCICKTQTNQSCGSAGGIKFRRRFLGFSFGCHIRQLAARVNTGAHVAHVTVREKQRPQDFESMSLFRGMALVLKSTPKRGCVRALDTDTN